MMTALSIRRAIPADYPVMRDITHAALREIAVSAYPIEEIEEAIATGAWTLNRALLDEGNYFVAEHNGSIVGGVGWDQEWLGAADTRIDRPASFASLRAMFVSPRMANQGIGDMLLAHCIDDIEAHGIRIIELYASFNAERLYERHGFRTLAMQSLGLASGAVMKGSRMRRDRMHGKPSGSG